MFTLKVEDYFPSSNDSVTVVRKFPQESFPEHSHEFGEIAFVSQGGGYNIINDSEHRLCSGSVLFLMPGDKHSFEDVNNLGLSNVIFKSPERYRDNLHKAGFVEGSGAWQIGPETQRNIDRLVTELECVATKFSSTQAANCYKEGILLQIFGLIGESRFTLKYKNSVDTRVRELVNYLRGNSSETIDWDEISARFGLSTRTMHRKIVEQTGLSPVKYLNTLRIKRAAKLLVSTEASVTHISYLCGFTDSNYFSTVFKQHYGVSPSQYRNHVQ